MATYLGTHGSKIQNYTTDPDNPNTGEVWYNETNQVLKFLYPNVSTAGSWRTDVDVNTARRGFGSNGTYTSSLIYGGYDSGYTGKTESWNGSAWSEVNDLNNARNGNTGAGADNTSALSVGGYSSTLLYNGRTESWNGTNWTEVNDLNQSRSAPGGTGTATAAIATGGNIPPNSSTTKNESWNGTNWTEVNDLNTAREGANSSNAGTQTAALFAGGHRGNPPPNVNTDLVEQWNGTNWTEVNDLNTAREHVVNVGTSTSALAYGGSAPPYTADTELWNGTNWTEQNNLSTARTQAGKGGGTTNALAVSGYNGSNLANVEAWTAAGVPIGVWSTGGALNTARAQNSGAGASNASGLTFGGTPIPGVAGKTEQYDGTSWTEVNDMNKGGVERGGTGVVPSALAFGVEDPNPPTGNNPDGLTESWNGTNWTEVADLNTARSRMGAAGVSNTSALSFGGTPSGDYTELWNGSSWTEVNDMNDARWGLTGNGTVTSALAVGGIDGPTTNTANTESWNGTNWTEVNNLNTGRRESASSGADNTSSLVFGGETPSDTEVSNTEEWNGVSWAEVNNLNVVKNVLAGNGTQSSALAYGGNPGPGVVATTEEWNQPSFITKTVDTD